MDRFILKAGLSVVFLPGIGRVAANQVLEGEQFRRFVPLFLVEAPVAVIPANPPDVIIPPAPPEPPPAIAPVTLPEVPPPAVPVESAKDLTVGEVQVAAELPPAKVLKLAPTEKREKIEK